MTVLCNVRLHFFASLREALGVSQERLATSSGTVGALRDELTARGGAWAEALARSRAVRCARNQVLCDESTALQEGDEVAFFPPVTGG